MERVLTIGVYGWDAPRWLEALQRAGCDQVVDIRARRGVRGSDYAFANRTRLEAALAQAGIIYVHVPELAPPREIRDAQVAADHAAGVLKRDRMTLATSFLDRYREGVVDLADWTGIASLITGSRPALLCVERVPAACHRSLAAERLARECEVGVEDLLP
jgi:uncharacterized protein (DUF488 family)